MHKEHHIHQNAVSLFKKSRSCLRGFTAILSCDGCHKKLTLLTKEILYRKHVTMSFLSLSQDMSILRDYLAYAKNNIQPRLSEEAAQSLIHAYVGKSKASFGF